MHETNRYNHFIYHSNLVHKQGERNTPSGHLDDLAINLTKIYFQDHWFKKLYIGIKLVGSLFGIMKNFTWDQYFYMGSQKFTLGSQYPMIPVGITPPPRSQCKIAILLLHLRSYEGIGRIQSTFVVGSYLAKYTATVCRVFVVILREFL